MAAEYICDGCGRRVPAEAYATGWHKPSLWFQRQDKDGIQDACSRECVELVAAKTDKPSTILPI